MTSREDTTSPLGQEDRRRSPLDQLPPPANSSKPLTPFSIEDILNKPSVRRSWSLYAEPQLSLRGDKLPPAGYSPAARPLLTHSSPLCALEELASKTFQGLEVSVLQAAEGEALLHFFPRKKEGGKRSSAAYLNQNKKKTFANGGKSIFKNAFKFQTDVGTVESPFFRLYFVEENLP